MKSNLKLNKSIIKSSDISVYLIHGFAFLSFISILLSELLSNSFGLSDIIYVLGLALTVSSFFYWKTLNRAFQVIDDLKEINTSIEMSLMANAKFTEKLLLIIKKVDKNKLLHLGIVLDVKENRTIN